MRMKELDSSRAASPARFLHSVRLHIPSQTIDGTYQLVPKSEKPHMFSYAQVTV